MKDKINTWLFLIFILSFSLLHIFMPDKEISTTERRKLATFPIVELNNEYSQKLEKYLLDQFPFRDDFRSIKANFNYHILHRLDNNNIYLKDNYIFKSNYPTNRESINNFIVKTNKIKNMLSDNNNVYLMIIPDKNYYLNDKDFLQIDYDYIYKKVEKLDIPFIDIRNIMNLNDYYETDTHWKQEKLDKVVLKMSNIMNFNYKKINYNQNVYNKFYGVYYGESAIKRNPEKIVYLTNDIINHADDKYLEHNNFNKVYNLDKLKGLDSYEVFLDGASSFIENNNLDCKNDKELVIFRDSFGSSLSPLLINYYSKITLIDNRYINSANFLKYIEFKNQDILFLYSTLMVNNSVTLKG